MSETSDRRKRMRFWFRLILAALVLAGMCGTIWIGEVIAEKKIASFPDYAPARRLMAGEYEGLSLVPGQHAVGQPYLLYIPAPNLEAMGHNAHGYRGAIVPVKRTPGVARILFLGGSTTYSTSVSNPLDAWPEVTARFLRMNLPPGIKDIEVINAAVPWGTSAEWLTHYLFKFHYYKPDIVVVNDSGCDASMIERSYYHPDYSNCRQSLTNIKPLPQRYRWMMKSGILGLFLLDCFQIESITRQTFVATEWQTKPLAPWFEVQSERIMNQQGFIPRGDELSFKHNLEALIQAASVMDGCKLLFIPFRPNPKSDYSEHFNKVARAMDEVFLEIAQRHQIPVAPFPAADLIPPQEWSDTYCHLTAKGDFIKGEYMTEFLAKLLGELGSPNAAFESP